MLRTTSPQADSVVSSVSLIAAMDGFSVAFRMPWNWMPWRVVMRSVPLPCVSASRSRPRYCAAVSMPPGMRTRTMNR